MGRLLSDRDHSSTPEALLRFMVPGSNSMRGMNERADVLSLSARQDTDGSHRSASSR